jgi:peptide methionine sulfoxide reductase msrA/msrB
MRTDGERWTAGSMGALVGLGVLGVTVLLLVSTVGLAKPGRREMERRTWRELSAEETRVIVHKGTERPFTGRYDRHGDEGRYGCKRCGAVLFSSEAKFDAGCGWPSFDESIPGAVREAPDADGRRTEILCAACGGHLGHVFRGEGHTDKDTRHCVNSLSLGFEAEEDEGAAGETRRAYFAGGCFWGVEHLLQALPGVVTVRSGYMGGHVDTPTYAQVSTGRTGHTETVEVVYEPAEVSYEALAMRFFEIHDPTQGDRQGPDVGPQYRSAVFVSNDAERAVITELLRRLRAKGFAAVTEIHDAETFHDAEEFHQDYYERTGKAPYCHARVQRFD